MSKNMNEISAKIGERIKSAREAKGLTQKDLGNYLGYSPMGISYFEKGVREIKISDLQKIAGFFGKSLSDFLPSTTTMFRAGKGSGESIEVHQSLSAFDKFLQQRKHK